MLQHLSMWAAANFHQASRFLLWDRVYCSVSSLSMWNLCHYKQGQVLQRVSVWIFSTFEHPFSFHMTRSFNWNRRCKMKFLNWKSQTSGKTFPKLWPQTCWKMGVFLKSQVCPRTPTNLDYLFPSDKKGGKISRNLLTDTKYRWNLLRDI